LQLLLDFLRQKKVVEFLLYSEFYGRWYGQKYKIIEKVKIKNKLQNYNLK